MSDQEATAYWKYHSRKHETAFRELLGDRSADQVRQDLKAFDEHQAAQLTAAEKDIAAAREAGKQEGVAGERRTAATAIFRAALEANGVTGDDLDEIAVAFNVDAYITDSGIDGTKIANFAKKFTPDTGDQTKRRDFGAGRRTGQQQTATTSAGKAEAQRRFGKPTS
ncbi:hypothetical protein [Nocardioides sp.]|uniref:hypothetical protein n=1 Tax=Nocardioides sp. TaxID=35761 RepID=UPI00262B37DD|nr:hypothetical protein [Nocardioides sp.]